MNSPTSQFVTSRSMGMFEPLHQMNMWGDFRGNGYTNTSITEVMDFNIKHDTQSEEVSLETQRPSTNCELEASNKPFDKVHRRLAQNREAARKSRLRKKAYVQDLETSRVKLLHLEQELVQARKQGMIMGGSNLDTSYMGYSGLVNSGIAAFETEYGEWVEEQKRQVTQLQNALSSHVNEIDLRTLIDKGIKHYSNLFQMKKKAAELDVFYVISGLWKTPAERFLLWIGGFRPSELLKILVPQLGLVDQQLLEVYNLAQSCQQAEDALTQGMEKVHITVVEAVANNQFGEGNHLKQLSNAMERLEALVMFVNQADHIRQETLNQITRILSTPQIAQALLGLGEYCQRLRALSALWTTQAREP
ncbi:transcription factor TGA1-like isoform X2 [Impatiens glandulifera]|uniref:transcription factor TGA1-like isoform X2 n=1 Tax=Impatiens glandulifera TaxID=253017 RepID=UPI001FB15478|nr:transcription factor TGA1-like isoform X2 [Impatiens glandulifera]